MIFEWDQRKADWNAQNHRVSFEEATTVFEDVFSQTLSDPDHSFDEERFITFGVSSRGRLLVVSHTYRRSSIRLISARKATAQERRIYEEEGLF